MEEKAQTYWMSESGAFIRFDRVDACTTNKIGDSSDDALYVVAGGKEQFLEGKNRLDFLTLFQLWVEQNL